MEVLASGGAAHLIGGGGGAGAGGGGGGDGSAVFLFRLVCSVVCCLGEVDYIGLWLNT